jgi:TetR/AcrR family transcriptional regulator, transcriptional repressor for nem operon
MRYPASETAEKHTRILDEATRLFRERGFSGVSVSEVMKATGLTHGPFYNHFDSKEALVAESLEHGFLRMLTDLEATAAGSPQGKARYLDAYLSPSHRDAPGTGCMIAALASEVRHEVQARTTFTRHLKVVLERFSSHFPWPSKGSSHGDAIRALSSMIGAVILARAVDDQAFSNEILHEVRKGLQ